MIGIVISVVVFLVIAYLWMLKASVILLIVAGITDFFAYLLGFNKKDDIQSSSGKKDEQFNKVVQDPNDSDDLLDDPDDLLDELDVYNDDEADFI